MNLSVAIQTHPLRSGLAASLAEEVGAEVVLDPEPDGPRSPWRCYREALSTSPADATHRVIVQDDATVCRSFRAALDLVVAARPEHLIALYVGGMPRRSAQAVMSACEAGETFAVMPAHDVWVPAVALVWPTSVIADVLAYTEGVSAKVTADDSVIARAVRSLRLPYVATVPSLVEHLDNVPSVAHVGRRTGDTCWRMAVCFIEDDCDPLEVDWGGKHH